MSDTVRVLRLVQYFGPRGEVEKQVANSIHGTRILHNGLRISATTLLEFPEMSEVEKTPDPRQLVNLQGQVDFWRKQYDTLLSQATEVAEDVQRLRQNPAVGDE